MDTAAFLINAAFALKQENRIGSIKKGKLASFVVMDKNLLADAAAEIIKAETLATIIDDDVVLSRAAKYNSDSALAYEGRACQFTHA